MKIRVGILTLSDRASKGLREDVSGKLIKDLVTSWGWEVKNYQVLPDEKFEIVKLLKNWTENGELDLIITNGGTGVFPRDVTPEATKEVIEKEIPGIPEYIRYVSYPKTPMAALTRGVAGVRKETLIINLPGSPKAIKEVLPELKRVIHHAIEKIKGDESECGGS